MKDRELSKRWGVLVMFLVLTIGNLDLVTLAPECFYVLVHFLKIILEVADIIVLSPGRGEDQFIAVSNLLRVLVESLGVALRLRVLSTRHVTVVVPDLESAARHHEKALDVVPQAALTAVHGRLRAAADAEQVRVAAQRPLLARLDVLVIGTICGLAAGLVEQDGAHAINPLPLVYAKKFGAGTSNTCSWNSRHQDSQQNEQETKHRQFR